MRQQESQTDERPRFPGTGKTAGRFFQALEKTLLAGLAAVLITGGGCRPTKTAPPPQPQGPLGLTTSLSTNMIHVGDPVLLTLTSDHAAGGQLRLPDLRRDKEIIVRDHQLQTKPLPNQRARTTARYVLTSFKPGTHLISSNAVQCALGGTNVLSQPFPTISLQVVSVLGGTNAVLRDIKDLARWPAAFPRWIWVLLLVAALALALGLAARVFLSKPRTILQHPPPPPPHEVALRALRALLSKKWIETENIEPFYVELSAIVRRYLEGRFLLNAPERTTEEFIREALNSRKLEPEHQRLTGEFLEQADLVKFAKYQPGQADMQAAYSAAERLVKETTPRPATPGGQPATPGGAA